MEKNTARLMLLLNIVIVNNEPFLTSPETSVP